MGVRRVAVPSPNSKSSERRKLQKTRWFRAGQRWRTAAKGRISVLKRRHGYKSLPLPRVRRYAALVALG